MNIYKNTGGKTSIAWRLLPSILKSVLHFLNCSFSMNKEKETYKGLLSWLEFNLHWRHFSQTLFQDSKRVSQCHRSWDLSANLSIRNSHAFWRSTMIVLLRLLLNPHLPGSNPPENVSDSLGGLGSPISDDVIAYSHFRWNRPRGYGFEFDFVELQQAGPSQTVEGKRFYSHPNNGLYSWPILKLHGSLNWFRNLGFKLWEAKQGAPSSGKIKEEIILQKSLPRFFEPTFARDLSLLAPIIITPTIYKDNLIYGHPVYERIFDPLWKMARNTLSNCRKLVVIGYSFPPTDFPTKRLLLESFSDHSLEELIVVNPDTSVCRTIKEICHFNKPVTLCADLDEFLNIGRKCA